MKITSTVVHLFINIFSSMVLSSCNFCAQCLVAPTRREVSTAHMVGDWLEIGASSYRNLRGTRIDGRRKALAIGLFIGSLPLHLLWNSVFFSAIPSSSYQVSLVTADFRSDAKPWDDTFISDSQFHFTIGANHTGARDSVSLQQLARESRLDRLNTTACIQRYLQTDFRRKSVILVAANLSMSDGLSWVPTNLESSLLYRFESIPIAPDWVWELNWLCSDAWSSAFPLSPRWCTEKIVLPRAEDWTMQFIQATKNQQVYKRLFAKIDYCLSAGVEEHAGGCAIRYSSILLLVVTALNGSVLVCIYFTWNIHRTRRKELVCERWEEDQLTTLDEAVSSFLQHEDQYTSPTVLEYCDYEGLTDFRTLDIETKYRAALYRLKSNVRWYRGAGRYLWYFTSFIFIGIAATIIFFLIKAFGALADYDIPTDWSSLWHMGFGEAHGYSITITKAIQSLGDYTFYGTLLLGNAFQVVLGIAWWLANSLLTRLLVAQRWARFIVKRSGLRVSSPKGQQRSSYTLSLPYRYSIPLIIISVLLHWLLSQAFFVVQTTGFVYDMTSQSKDQFVRDRTRDGSVIGYSAIAFILAVVIVLGIFISIVLLAMKTLPSRELQACGNPAQSELSRSVTRMPLSLTCSAAISAACHPGSGSQDAHLDLVQWGKMKSGKWSITNETPLRYSLDN